MPQCLSRIGIDVERLTKFSDRLIDQPSRGVRDTEIVVDVRALRHHRAQVGAARDATPVVCRGPGAACGDVRALKESGIGSDAIGWDLADSGRADSERANSDGAGSDRTTCACGGSNADTRASSARNGQRREDLSAGALPASGWAIWRR